MKSYYTFTLLALCLIVLDSCDISPVAIAYNEDQCAACKMLISNSQFGSELVTKKGKVYKFDAIECLIPELLQNGIESYEYIMVTDFSRPKTLIDATKASYLISEKVPSPMGAYLSAYHSHETAKKANKRNGGKLYSWEEICQHNDFVLE